MIETAARTGFISQETLQCSQELDIIINLYMKFCPQEGKILPRSMVKNVDWRNDSI